MADTDELIERSGEFKRALLALAQSRRYRKHLQAAMQDRFGDVVVGDEAEVGNFFDYFLLQHRLPDGRTLIEHYVAAHPELEEDERAMLLGWQDVVEGIFAVQRREQDALMTVNLVDGMTYRIRSNMGRSALAPMRPRSFLITRVVPVGDEWLLSGYSHILPASNRQDAIELAQKLALQRPALVFRNPQKLEQAWELQRRERQDFIAFFGSDLIIIPGHELQERLNAYHHFRVYELRDSEGRTAAERAKEKYGVVPNAPEMEFEADLIERETVGVIFDEIEGFNLFPDLGTVEEAFATPQLASRRLHREEVLGYLESPGISPLPLRRLAERNPEHASQVFRQVLKRPDFDWERDGEALLQRYKASYLERAPMPGTVPVDSETARALLTGAPSEKTPGRRSRGRGPQRGGKKRRR